MKKEKLSNGQYLCAIGTIWQSEVQDKIDNYRVGRYDNSRQTFSFSNGSYSDTELCFREKMGGNITCVVAVKEINEIDFDKD